MALELLAIHFAVPANKGKQNTIDKNNNL